MATYSAHLGSEDYFNSKGVRLTTMAAIIAQDRANFHRFGVRHKHDSADPLFSKRAARAQIANAPVVICCGLEEHVTKGYDRGLEPFLAVTVFGRNGRITRISLDVPG